MITHLTAQAQLPISGASLKSDYQPKNGITAVVGENGSGKTFLSIESVRWLLYGKPALRGAAADYKDTTIGGTLVIRGAPYTISRGKAEWVKDASGSVVAKGAEKVTEYLTEVMGYPLEVFDLCNAATQGNVQKLGNMRPAERKAIIDKVLRLTEAEATEKSCRTEATGFRREAEALTSALRAPGAEPVCPANYTASLDLRQRIARVRTDMDKAEALRGQLRHVEAPKRPQVADFSEDAIAELETHEQQRLTANAERWQLEQVIAKRPARPQHTDHIIQQGLRVYAYNEAVAARGDAPTMPLDAIEAGEAAWSHRGTVMLASDMRATCPSCGTAFRVGGEIPPEPAVSELDLLRQRKAHERHAVALPLRARGDDTATPITAREADQLRAEARQHDAARAAEARLVEISDLVDRSAELSRMRQDKATLEAFLAEQTRYERVRAQNEAVQRDLDALGHQPSSEAMAALYDALSASERYEADCRAYDQAMTAYKDLTTKIAEATRLADEFAAGAKDVAAARATVKALIAPKISRIATALIRDMSAGKLVDLVVDDDMEITVGGQRIETLSGAGKTVANLALRVAMGRALVGHVFPVFLADEIDGDMDMRRREATLQALVSLKAHLSQIILVTHRGAAIADHVWDVTE